MTRLRLSPSPRFYPTLAGFVDAHPIGHDRRDLIAVYSRRALERALREGSAIRVLSGVYVGARHAREHAALCDAALLWSDGRAVITGTSAVYLHGLIETPPPQVTLATDRGTHLRGPDWLTILRTSTTPVRVRVRGLSVAAMPDAILQSWGQLPPDRATSLILDAMRDRRIQAGDLALRALDYPRIPRRRALDRLLSDLGGGAESYLEHLAMTRVFNTREFQGFERQVETTIAGRRYILDMYHEASRVAVELDGRRFHGDDVTRRRDLARDADLASIGITTIRLTFEDVTGRPMWCRTRVRRAVSAHRRLRAV
jgi:very-short-patch-repair endonuclease